MSRELYLIGSGGLGREMLVSLNAVGFLNNYNKLAFIDNHQGVINGVEIAGDNNFLKTINYNVDVLISLSNPEIRRKIINEFSNYSNLNFISFIHPKATIYDFSRVKIGKGVYIAESCLLTTDIQIGDFFFLNVGVSLHHDVILEENCILMPGARITGGAKILKDTYLGTNYAIADNRTIEQNSKLILNL